MRVVGLMRWDVIIRWNRTHIGQIDWASLIVRAFLPTGAYMGHCVCVCVCVSVRLCVWGYCLYRLLVLMFRSVLACVNMKLFGSVHAIAMLYIIVCMCAFPRTV